ncbi:hypothetical protein BY458DRAFT_318051 [Sporodiniella umbellata]|nr:hypothetical protein BY458DRAFT_318051 [Sporodiniella umbellata]
MVCYSTYETLEEPKTSVIEYLFSNPYNTPKDRPLLIDALDPKKFITFEQLRDLVLQFAAALQDLYDFQTDDVLALYAINHYNYSIPLFGAIAAGGAVSPANPNYNVEELAYQLKQSNAKVLVCDGTNIDNALLAAKKVGILRENIFLFGDQTIQGIPPFTQALLQHTRRAPIIRLSYKEAQQKVAYLCFSSGTTGKSKGVMTTHANATATNLHYIHTEKPGFKENDERIINVLPLFHIFGLMSSLHSAFILGIPVYFLPRFDLTLFCKTIEHFKITYAFLIPAIYLAMIKNPLVSKYDLSSLRLTLSGAAPLSSDLVQATKARFPHMLIKQAYGLTETSPCVMIEPTERIKMGSVGLLLPNLVAKVIDDDGQEVPQGERGELCIKGSNIMKGYIHNQQATDQCIDAEGYFHTGDIVTVDEDQHFFIVDRKKELIKYKGFQVPPAELEGILVRLPMVNDCAVIGVYDETQATEIPRAYIALKADTAPTQKLANEITKYVADQVVAHKQIRSLRFVNSIPRSSSGKILRRVLRDQSIDENRIRNRL